MGGRTRVWQLARELGVTTAGVTDALKALNEPVTSHLCTISGTTVDDLRRTLRAASGYPAKSGANDAQPLRIGANPFISRPPGRQHRRRLPPGPAAVTYQPSRDPQDYPDHYPDPVRELRQQPVLSTRDVAELCGVSTGCVRQWVTRGHLLPVGRNGASYIFDTATVLEAADVVSKRRRRRARPVDRNARRLAPTGFRNSGQQISSNELLRMARVYGNRALTTADAAAVLGIKPVTIRNWVSRGHLKALPTSEPRRLEFGLIDLLRSVGHRHL